MEQREKGTTEREDPIITIEDQATGERLEVQLHGRGLWRNLDDIAATIQYENTWRRQERIKFRTAAGGRAQLERGRRDAERRRFLITRE